jgi:amino acid transporter
MSKNMDAENRQVADADGESKTRELQHNALGLLATAAMTAAYMGPALSIYALFGPMTAKVGTGVGFVMIIATSLTLLSAISFGMLAKEMPSAGGLYAWSRVALGESAGRWVGLNTIFYYLICLVFAPIVFGQHFNALVALAVDVPPESEFWTWSWFAGALLAMGVGGYVTYRGIVVSAHMAFTLLLIELAVVAALSFTFMGFAASQGNFTLAPMTFAACQDGWKGIFLALPMGLLSTVCDAAVPAGEETRNARRTIPIAVFLTCLMVGIWYVIGFSAFAMGRSTADVSVSSVQSGITPMAERVWGPWKILVSLTAMSASLGALIPVMTAASRMIFAMAREGKLPGAFAKLNPRYLAPWNAIHLAFAFTFLAILPVFKFGADATIEWWSSTIGWFIGIVYIAANLVNIVYYWRFARSQFHWALNFAIPGVALIVHICVVWQSAIVELWGTGLAGQSAQAFMLVTGVGILVYSLFMRTHSFTHEEPSAELVADR